MSKLRKPRTQFVSDRISETKFSDMDFIMKLLVIEDNIQQYPDYPRGSGSMWQLYFHYQMERDAIKAEMLEDRITTIQEYRGLKYKEALEIQKQRAGYEHKAAEEKNRKLEQWLRRGGLPD